MDGLAARTLITLLLVGTWAGFSGSLFRLHSIPSRAWFFLAIEAFFATFAGDLAYYAAIKWGNIGNTSLVLSVSPIITLLMGWFFMGESISFLETLGAFFILTGLILVASNSL